MKMKHFVGLTAAVLGVVLVVNAADVAKVSDEDGRTAQRVASMIKAQHINHPDLDDEISTHLLDRYIKVWDPQKLYFLKSDVDEFRKSAEELDDEIKAGDVEFANKVFARFIDRMNEHGPMISAHINAEHDFTADEEMTLDADDVDWAADKAALKERWRKRIKYEILNLRLEDTEAADIKERLEKRYSRNRKLLAQTESHEILELYLSSLTHCLDPHTSYMSPQTLEDFRINMELKLEGIGARLKFQDGNTVVEEVIEGGAAAAHGKLKKGDKIIGVDPDGPEGKEGMIDVVEMKLSKVVDKIRGPAKTTVTLRVKPEGAEVVNYTMKRQTVKLTEQEVKGKIIDASKWADGRGGKIGVLNIPSFYRDFRQASRGGDFKSTSRDVRKVLDQFKAEGVDSLIVDLRWNGGGALQEAIEVSGLFIPRGPVVQVREPGDRVRTYTDDDPGMAWTKPMFVVCNRLSASASEIFAGAMKDYHRAIIVGDRTTHGKGSVQNVMQVAGRLSFLGPDRGALKLTISKFYRVNGATTQKKGVESDVVLPSLLNNRDIGEDALDFALDFDRIQKASYIPFTGFGNDKVTRTVAANSAARLKESKDFAKVRSDIARYVERKNRKTITLNEAKLREEEEALKREREEEEETMKKASGNDDEKDIFVDNPYNRELVNITLDYTDAIQAKTKK